MLSVAIPINLISCSLYAPAHSHAHSHAHSQSLSLALRNIFGRAEQLEVTSGTSFPLWGHNVQLQFTKPYYKNFDKKYATV